MAISCLGFIQYNDPVLPWNIQDQRRSSHRFFDILILFCGDDLSRPSKLTHGRLPKYLIDGRTFWTNRNDSKKPPGRAGGFSSCSRPNLTRVFSALARLYYLARPTKTATLRRLLIRKRREDLRGPSPPVNTAKIKDIWLAIIQPSWEQQTSKKISKISLEGLRWVEGLCGGFILWALSSLAETEFRQSCYKVCSTPQNNSYWQVDWNSYFFGE